MSHLRENEQSSRREVTSCQINTGNIGDQMRQTLEEAVGKYQKSLYLAAYHICRNAEDANDVVQETFVQYFHSEKEFSDEDHIRAWLNIYDNNERGIGGSEGTEGVEIVQDGENIYLEFGKNRIDLTRQIETYGNDDQDDVCAAGKILFGERMVVYEVSDTRRTKQLLEEEFGADMSGAPDYVVSFFDYEAYLQTPGSLFRPGLFLKELEETPAYEADK